MSIKNKTQKKNSKQKNNIFDIDILPLIMLVALVPLIVYVKQMNFNDAGHMYWDSLTIHYDIFSYYKMVFILVFATLSAAIVVFHWSRKELELTWTNFYIPMVVYAFFVFLSSAFSQYPEVAKLGFLDRYEGTYVLIAYMIIVFTTMTLINSEKRIKLLFQCLLVSAGVLGIIGVMQYFGYDIFKWDFFKGLIVPASLKSTARNFKINMARDIYVTLFNPNYVGSYTAMLIPLVLSLLLCLKNKYYRIVLAFIGLLMLFNLFGSHSRAGIVGTVFAVLVVLLFSRGIIIKHYKYFAGAALIIVAFLFVLNISTKGSILYHLTSITEKVENAAIPASATAGGTKTQEQILDGLKDIRIEKGKAIIITSDCELNIILDNNSLSFTDEKRQPIKPEMKDKKVSFMDNGYRNITMEFNENMNSLKVYLKGLKITELAFTNEGIRTTDNRWMLDRGDKQIEALGFLDMETLGSGRGYIWSRSLPLLKDTLFLGHGPDTFPMYFPQYDYVGKLKVYSDGGMFVDKAHNMYLQTAINTGVISLIAFLVMFLLYAVSSIRTLYKSKFDNLLSIAGLACFAAFCGYVAAGLFNDSVVSVAPVFWVLFGLGIGINIKLQKQ